MLTLGDDDLWQAIWAKSPPLSPNHVQMPAKDRIKAMSMYRRILRTDKASRREHLSKAARKMLVFVNLARARRGSTGLTLAEYLEAKLWRLRRDTERIRRNRERHPAGTGNAMFEQLDIIERNRIARVLDLLAVLDTNAKLDEDAVGAIAERAKAIDQEERLAFASVAGFPPHLTAFMDEAKDKDAV
jgi:hypothetical protein